MTGLKAGPHAFAQATNRHPRYFWSVYRAEPIKADDVP